MQPRISLSQSYTEKVTEPLWLVLSETVKVYALWEPLKMVMVAPSAVLLTFTEAPAGTPETLYVLLAVAAPFTKVIVTVSL